MEEVKRKRGRPAKDGGRKKQFRIMLSEEELEKLRLNSKKVGESQAEFLRESMLMRITEVECDQAGKGMDDEYDEFWDDYHDGFDELEGI